MTSDDEPSVDWGWHTHYPRTARVMGFVTGAVLLILLHGNNNDPEAPVWLVVLALGCFGLSIGSIVRARRSWRH